MQRLNEQITFEGRIETITMMDLRSRPGEIMTAVSSGKTFILERNGTPIAMVSKLPGKELTTVVNSNGTITYKISG